MHKKLIIGLVGLAVLAFGVAVVACGGATAPAEAPTQAVVQAPTEPPPTEPPPTEAPTEPPTEAPATQAPPAEAPTEPPATDTPAPTEAPAEMASADNCIGCHTDQPTLQALAVDQEVKSEATSGEG